MAIQRAKLSAIEASTPGDEAQSLPTSFAGPVRLLVTTTFKLDLQLLEQVTTATPVLGVGSELREVMTISNPDVSLARMSTFVSTVPGFPSTLISALAVAGSPGTLISILVLSPSSSQGIIVIPKAAQVLSALPGQTILITRVDELFMPLDSPSQATTERVSEVVPSSTIFSAVLASPAQRLS